MAFVSSSNNNSTNGEINTTQAVNTAIGVFTAGTQVNTNNIDNLSDAVICAFLASQLSCPQLVNKDLEQIHPDNLEKINLKWQMAMLTIRARRFLKKIGRKLTVNGNETIGFDKTNMECYNCHKRGHFATEYGAPRSQDTKHKEITRRIVPMETPASTALVSCDGLGGFDWSDQAKEGPNYALMAYTSTSLDSKNEQLTKDLKKSELMVLGYKSGLESVEERFKFFKTNESVYIEDINLLKVKIQMKDIAITELKRKLDLAQKETDKIQLVVDKLENESKSLNKLIDCQIVDNCKKWLGYENYNDVSPPYTGNFMPPKPDLSYIGLDEFAVKPVVENKSSEKVTKAVRKNPDAPIVQDWVSDDEEKEVTQPKIEKKTVKPSFAKIEFVRSKEQVKSLRKTTVKQVNAARQMSYLSKLAHSTVKRPIHKKIALNNSNVNQMVNNVRSKTVNTARPKAVVNVVKKIFVNVVKASACWVWKFDHVIDYGNLQMDLHDKGVIDSGCSSHMTGNMSYLIDYEEIDGGYVAFGEAVNTACYVQNRVLVVKPHNKTIYELFHGKTPTLRFMRPFGCLVTILNTLDNLGKFDGKTDEGFFVGYLMNSIKACDNAGQARKEKEPVKDYILLPLWTVDHHFFQDLKSSQDNGFQPSSDSGNKVDQDPSKGRECRDQEQDDNVNSTNMVNVSSTNRVNVVDINNMNTTIQVSPVPTTRIHKDHPLDQMIRDLHSTTQTRNMSKNFEEHGLFLAYASFKDFVVYQMDVKSAFVYGKIKKEVYVCRPPGFKDLGFSDKVYKVKKALYGLHQAPRAWYETLSTYLLDNRFYRGKIDKTLFIRRHKGDILLVQVYVDDIIFGSLKKELCNAFEKMMHEKFQMSSMGELTFFLGLFIKVKNASTPMKIQKPMLKDEDGKEVDVHMYRSMIGLLMYLTSLRPDIMFAVCACARYQVNLKVSHLHAVKRIFRYLKGQPKFGLWYLKDSSFDLVAYTDSDYARASLDRKSTTGGCQFLRCRLISWQCKKQTMVANSTTEAEYLAASSCCGLVLWIQNQLLDYEKSARMIMKAKIVAEEVQLQALVDGKKVIITESTVRRDLQLEDAKGVDYLPNTAIFEQLTLMGYEKISQKLTSYKAFFSSQWKFLINTILQCLSSKTTVWNEFSSTMASAIICLAINQKFNFSKYIFESMVKNLDNVNRFLMYPSVLDLENTKTTQALSIDSLKRRVKKLEKKQRLRTHKLKTLYKVGLTARVESSDDDEDLGEDASKQRRISDIDADEDITLVSTHDDA
uniref:Putative ribonuclease H-like domain-containing protein n=1 Tax=Tanacetum cinerariifolium TaxID=118510 RepID=A0A699GP24_TANCI|nr:putative ribonuclease H-like domain-containing protein [Tanacetum cinerariifolium]